MAAACCGAARASAVETPITIHSATGRLAAGSEVAVSWGDLPRGVLEFELLLVCSEPGPLEARLTESLDPGLRQTMWTVPNLPCDRASLRLRVGIDGEESVRGASAPFRIEWDRAEPPPQVSARGGELWLAPPLPDDTSIAATFPVLAHGEAGGDIELAPTFAPRELQAAFADVRGASVEPRPHVVRGSVLRPQGAVPLTVPLRI